MPNSTNEEWHANSKFLAQEHIIGLLTSNLVPFACFHIVSWPVLRTPSATSKDDVLGSTRDYGKPRSCLSP